MASGKPLRASIWQNKKHQATVAGATRGERGKVKTTYWSYCMECGLMRYVIDSLIPCEWRSVKTNCTLCYTDHLQ